MSDSEDHDGQQVQASNHNNKLIKVQINQDFEEHSDGQSTNQTSLQNNEQHSFETVEQDDEIDDELRQRPKVVVSEEPHVGGIEELEPDQIWNKYIKTGYRINYDSWKMILKSAF